MSKQIEMDKIKIGNVRLSFPNLFKMGSFNGESTGKYDATFLLDKKEHKEAIKQIKTQFKQLAAPNGKLQGKMPSDDRLCLKDGDETERKEQVGCYTLKASTKRRPILLDRDKTPVTEDDNLLYAGCYVNVIVSLWAQNNAYGKRINASLGGVQFCGHGEPFGAPQIDQDEFDVFGDEDDEDDELAF
jgi:hypothetical protein